MITQSAAAMSEALSKGEVTSTELTQAHLDRIAGVDSSVKAFLHVDAEGALGQAARVDADHLSNCQTLGDEGRDVNDDPWMLRELASAVQALLLERWDTLQV